MLLGDSSRRVNSGVMSALRIESTVNPAAPLLRQADVDEVVEGLVECRSTLPQPVRRAHSVQHQLLHCC
jgi:hypothetical protein